MLRKNEFDQVLESYQGMGLNVTGVDSKRAILDALKGISEPEGKRKAIGRTFIEVFDEEAHKIQDVEWLAQGTIYPDVIESISVKGPSATIKSHHNVGGLPDVMKLKIIEPLNSLFKDEVRKIGKAMDMPEAHSWAGILSRVPDLASGLSVKYTAEKIRILQDVDDIFIEGLKKTWTCMMMFGRHWQFYCQYNRLA